MLLVAASWTRKETVALQEHLAELQLKVKVLVVQTRLTSQAEIKILLAKADAVFSQIAQLEKIACKSYKKMQCLSSEKQDLLSLMGMMAPVSELNSVKAESSKLQEEMKELKLALRAAKDKIEQQADTIQVCSLHHPTG